MGFHPFFPFFLSHFRYHASDFTQSYMNISPVKKFDAYPVYLILEGASALFSTMVFTVNMVYQVTVVNLNPLQLVLVGTVLETTAFLCEVPTGVVADVYSRRLSVLIGIFLIGAGFVLQGAIPLFSAILLSQVVSGVGYTFTSGATQAWIADEVGEANAGRAFLRGAQASQLGALVGIVASVSLASIQVHLPIVVGGGLMVALGVFLLLVMPERGFTPIPSEGRTSWGAMAHTLRNGMQLVRRRPALITILSIGGIYGMFSEGFDRLWTPHVLENFTLPSLGKFQPVVWFGIINAGSMLLTLVVTELARQRLDTNSHLSVARALFAINTVLIAGIVAFGVAGHFALALATLWIISPLRRMNTPIYTAWVNQRLDPKVRATVISMSSQADALGQIIGGPIVGVIGKVVSVRAAIVVSGIVLSPALLLYARTMRRGKP